MATLFLRWLVVFVGWTLTSFACHFCAKLFLKEAAPFKAVFSYHVIVLTGLQIIFFLAFTQVSDKSDTEATKNKYVIFSSHACATLTTNWSMSVTYAASTFAIKLMEPLTSAVLQRYFIGVRLSNLQWISIPAVVYGAIVFTEDGTVCHFNVSHGVILAFISNICLSLRNVYMKKNHMSKIKFSINNLRRCWGVLVLLLIIGILLVNYLEYIEIAPAGSVYVYSLLIGSSLFHVCYSYISTIIVLKHCSVVGHAFGNILKRFSVLGFLYMAGSRTASASNFIGLFICVTGLAVYTLFKTHKTENYTVSKEFVTKFANTVRNKLSAVCISAAIVVMVFLTNYGKTGSSFTFNRNSVTYSRNISLLKPLNFSIDDFFTVDLVQKPKEANKLSSLLTKIPDVIQVAQRNLSLSKPLNFSIDDFFSVDLVQNPEEANKLSPLLTTRPDVIEEAQRIHKNMFKSLLGRYKYAMLFHYSPSENKGDSAIAVGEVILLRKLNISVVFACKHFHCTKQHLDKAQDISMNYTDNELVILFHGGGNVIGWPGSDHMRSEVIPRFMRFNIIMFPQSILYIKPQSHIDFCTKLYATHPKLTFIWRDKNSYTLGKKLFPKVRSLLSPDMAYQIGFVPRFMHPIYDILWIKRKDKESPVYETPQAPIGLRMHVSDWVNWKTPRGTSPMEDTFLITTNGMMFLQRGRIVITDRLHGHILSTLLAIPHVYIDNKQRKISNYHNTWTAGLENIILANSSLDAIAKARQLLIKLDKDLPEIKGFYTNTS